MQRGIGPALRTSRGVVAIAVALGALAALLLVAGPAGAEPGWSRTPASGLPGATIHVASSPATLCQWLAPADPVATVTSPESAPPIGPAAPGDPIVYDGVRIELRLRTGATELAIGAVTVTPGGAWSGDVTVATAATAVSTSSWPAASSTIPRWTACAATTSIRNHSPSWRDPRRRRS